MTQQDDSAAVTLSSAPARDVVRPPLRERVDPALNAPPLSLILCFHIWHDLHRGRLLSLTEMAQYRQCCQRGLLYIDGGQTREPAFADQDGE